MCLPNKSHSLDSISVITDYTQSSAANLSNNPLPESSISTVDSQQVSDNIQCTNSFAVLSDSTDDSNNMLMAVCAGDSAQSNPDSTKSSSLSSLFHASCIKNIHSVAYFHRSTKDGFNISSNRCDYQHGEK